MYFLKPIQDVRSAYLWIYFGERRLLRSLLLGAFNILDLFLYKKKCLENERLETGRKDCRRKV